MSYFLVLTFIISAKIPYTGSITPILSETSDSMFSGSKIAKISSSNLFKLLHNLLILFCKAKYCSSVAYTTSSLFKRFLKVSSKSIPSINFSGEWISHIKYKQIKVRGDEIRSTSNHNKTQTMQKQTFHFKLIPRLEDSNNIHSKSWNSNNFS